MPTPETSIPPRGPRPERRGRAVPIAALAGLAVVALAGLGAWWASAGGEPATSSAPPQVSAAGAATVGAPAPGFDVPRLFGAGRLDLRAFAGRPVVVDFWASWCHPCRESFPLLRDALARHARDGLVVIGLTYQDIPGDSRDFARSQHATWPMGIDSDSAVAAAYGVRAIPQTFFVTRDGHIAQRLYGLTSPAELERALAKILPSTVR